MRFSRLRFKFADDFLVAAFKLCVPSRFNGIAANQDKEDGEMTLKKTSTYLNVIACAF